MSEETTEQQQEQTTADPASRDELIEAVRQAGGTESVDVAAEAEAAGTPPPAKEEPAGEEPAILAKIRDREEAWKKTQQAESYAERLQREAQENAQRIIAEAQEKARLQHEQWLTEQQQKYKSSPSEYLRTLGDPAKVADDVLAENTPEARQRREIEERVAKAEAGAKTADEVKAELASVKQALARERYEAQVAEVKGRFLGQHANEERTPYAHVHHKGPDGVFKAADDLATQWQKTGMKLGVDFDFDDVAKYIEHQAKQELLPKLSKLGIAPQQVGGAAPQGAGTRPQGLANGSRTLSAAAGSERRTSPKPVSEMTPEEERQALIEEVAKARRTVNGSTP